MLTLSGEEVMQRLRAVTSLHLERDREIIFTGWVKDNRFKIAMRHKRPSSYNPLIAGRVESTSQGCILFTHYQLMPNLKMILLFWMMILMLGTIIVSFQYKSLWHLAGGFGFLAFITWIVWSNFRLQRKLVRKRLMEVLS